MPTGEPIAALNARLMTMVAGRELPSRARELGEKASVLTRGSHLPARGERGWAELLLGCARAREKLGLGWAARPRWPLAYIFFLFFSFSFFCFQKTDFNKTFEIQIQIGSNQFEQICKIKLILLTTLEPFLKYFIFI